MIEKIYKDGLLVQEATWPDSPARVAKWDAYDFKLRFTPDERVAIRTAGESDGYIADFLDMLDTAAATGTHVHANDALVTLAFYVLEEANILTEARSAEILGAES